MNSLFKRKIALSLLALSFAGSALADEPPIKVGFMLPYTGTYAALGNAITNGFKQYVNENGGKLGGRTIEYASVDDESDPAKATENANRLVKREKVDVLVGTVHSGVALAMARVAKESKTLMIVPNAGAGDLTGAQCMPNLFRTSFSNWQPAYAMGVHAAKKGIKRAVTLTWKYAAGTESTDGFKEGFTKNGGTVVKELTLPFPNTEFQPFLTEIAAIKPDAVYVFFAGGGAAKFMKDYAAAGLKNSVQLLAAGFLTDGTIEAAGVGGAPEGLLTTLHYADGLKNSKDTAFRTNYAKTFKSQPDVYAVQGYDAAQLLGAGLTAVKGNFKDQASLIKAMEKVKVDSPRGAFTLSKAHNPVQDIYLRKVVGRDNHLVEVSVKALADPATGCKM
mgnify:FL=1